MALVFTNEQILNITKDIILIPSLINDPSTGYIAQKSLILASKDSLQKTDDGQKVFSDFWSSVVQAYHSELTLLNSSVRTNYDVSNIVTAASGSGLHFPSTWVNLPPKLIDSNNGNPITTSANKHLLDYITDEISAQSLLVSGFTDGAVTDTVTITGSTFTVTTGVFVNGNRVVLSNGTSAFVGKITGVAGSVYTFTVLYGTAFTGSATCKNFFSGFTNAQRDGISPTAPYTAVYTALTSGVDTKVTDLKTHLTSIQTTLQSNGDLSPRKTSVQTALTNIQTAISTINTWLATSATGTSGRYTDSKLANLTTTTTNLTSQRTSRITEIGTNLGSVSQSSDGSYSGSGAYLDLFKMVDLRSARGTGSLSQVNQIALGVLLFDKKIASANDQLTQYTNTFALTKISSDTIVGQTSFQVESTSGFSIGDSVYVMDNSSIVYTKSIQGITGNVITLTSAMPIALSVSNLARIAKQK